jgi:hypothetical protein
LPTGTRLRHGTRTDSRGSQMQPDPDPSYDFSDELEFYFKYLPWGLRGVTDGQGYPPPAYPPV